MHAVVETGGKQYRVAPGDIIDVEKLPGEVGAEVQFDAVAVIGDDAQLSKGPARVKATIESHGRGRKVLVFKFKRKKQYKRTIGHRQGYTRLKVGAIEA
jgi:large subunit ribosomal protein L21